MSKLAVAATSNRWLVLVLVRWMQHIGIVGAVGVGLVVTAAVVYLADRQQQSQAVQEQHQALPAIPVPATRTSIVVPADHWGSVRARLPPASELPLILTRLERAAVGQQLGWPQADYRFNAATAQLPASVEVRCVLRGTYLRIRGFVGAMLLDMPTLSLREFSLSRSGATDQVVEARLTIVVYLDDGTSPTQDEAR